MMPLAAPVRKAVVKPGARGPRALMTALTLCGVFLAPAPRAATSGEAGLPAIALVPAARPGGLAGAYVALGQGSSSLGINPAGLAAETGSVFTGSVRPDMSRAGAVSYAFPGFGGRWAAAATYVDYGEIPATDENQGSLGTLKPFSLYPSVTYARAHGERLSWGATAKLARETLGDFDGSTPAWGAAMDLGVRYVAPGRQTGFGLAATNIGRQLSGHFDGDERRAALPAALRGGAFYQPRGQRRLVLTADLEAPLHGAPALALGGEYRALPEWELRAGTRWSRDDLRNALAWIDPNAGVEERGGEALKLGAGTTVRIGPVAVDYAAQWWRELGLVHALTVAFSPGR